MDITQTRNIAVTSNWEPMRKNMFDLVLPTTVYSGSASDFSISLMKSPLPGAEIGLGETPAINETRKWAKAPAKYEAFVITLKDYAVSAGVASALNSWFKSAFDSGSGQIGPISGYKGDGALVQYGLDGSTILRSWTLHGMWLRAFKMGEGERGNGEQSEISGTIEIDYATLDTPAQ
jgi:hypothetical protein